jgi:prepilin-type N-terminal cleavage/methylation domain-containing protein
MKTHVPMSSGIVSPEQSRETRGFTLIELLAYMAILVVVSGLAFAAYLRCLNNSRLIQGNASDISQALNAGERWREDVRMASGFSCSESSLTLTQAAGVVQYVFESNAVYRIAGDRSARTLNEVKSSRMSRENFRIQIEPGTSGQHDNGAQTYPTVVALRWELELATVRTNPALRPLFTFKAVPALSPKRLATP